MKLSEIRKTTEGWKLDTMIASIKMILALVEIAEEVEKQPGHPLTQAARDALSKLEAMNRL